MKYFAFSAHRLMYKLKFGHIPEGLCVLHKCDNKLCANPSHLFLGTLNDNNQDKKLKGRSGHKLTDQEVIEIRKLSMISSRELCNKYQVSISMIQKIRNRTNWKHL